MRRLLIAVAALVATTVASTAVAQTDAKASAEVLFQDARKLMTEKRYADACPKFLESLRLETGIGVMLYLADCFEKNGQTASAWAQFREVEALARREGDNRMKVAEERAVALESRLAKIVIDVPASAAVQGLEVHRDGASVGSPLWGTPTPVDPGKHVVTARAPGRREWHVEVVVEHDGELSRVAVPLLDASPAEAPAAVTMASDTSSTERATPGATQRTIAIVTAGVGVVALGAGTVFGAIAISKNDDSKAAGHCDGASSCDDVGYAARKDAQSAATISTGALIGGGVLVAASAVLFFTAPRAASRVVIGPRSLILRF